MLPPLLLLLAQPRSEYIVGGLDEVVLLRRLSVAFSACIRCVSLPFIDIKDRRFV